MVGSGKSPTPDAELERTLARFTELVRDQTSDEALFNGPCDQTVIDELEATTGLSLPADYKAVLRLGNGTRDPLSFTFPPDQLSFMSAEDVLEAWRFFAEDPDDTFFDEFGPDERVRSVLMHPGRVPIAQNELGGLYLAIDYVPGPSGVAGQLVFNINEADCVVLADNVTELVRGYVTALETGAMAIQRVPEEFGGLYWFTANGRNVDYQTYRDLRP